MSSDSLSSEPEMTDLNQSYDENVIAKKVLDQTEEILEQAKEAIRRVEKELSERSNEGNDDDVEEIIKAIKNNVLEKAQVFLENAEDLIDETVEKVNTDVDRKIVVREVDEVEDEEIYDSSDFDSDSESSLNEEMVNENTQRWVRELDNEQSEITKITTKIDSDVEIQHVKSNDIEVISEEKVNEIKVASSAESSECSNQQPDDVKFDKQPEISEVEVIPTPTSSKCSICPSNDQDQAKISENEAEPQKLSNSSICPPKHLEANTHTENLSDDEAKDITTDLIPNSTPDSKNQENATANKTSETNFSKNTCALASQITKFRTTVSNNKILAVSISVLVLAVLAKCVF